MTILLADDERMVRLGLISMLDELFPGEHRYIEARNGEELVSMTRLHRPDVSFVDIRMPLMDGLTALEQAQAYAPHTTWMVLTGYAEFSYAREALRLGVQEYLLKPVPIEDLRDAMDRAAQLARHTSTQLNKTFGFDMVQAYNLYQLCREVEDEAPGSYTMQVFFIDHWDVDVDRQHYSKLYRQVKQLYQEEALAEAYALFVLNTGELCAIMLNLNVGQAGCRLQALLNDHLEACVTIAEATAGEMRGVLEALDRIVEVSPLRCIRGFSDRISLPALEQWAAQDGALALSRLLLEITEAYQQQDWVAYKKELDALERLPSAHAVLGCPDCTAPQYLHYAFDLEAGGKHCSVIEALRHGIERMPSGKNRRGDSFADQAQQYVQRHYMEQIGIDTVARIFELTPSYVSRLFHQKTGRKFIDYLTEVRMLNAKRILADCTVQQTAATVGYLSTRHFTKLFLRFTGMLPSDYQRTLQPKSGITEPNTLE